VYHSALADLFHIAAFSFAFAPNHARGRLESSDAFPSVFLVFHSHDGQSLTLVDLAVPGAAPHDNRETDPYNAAFFGQLGQIEMLESLNVVGTKCNDGWIPHLAGLKNLKSLRLINNGLLTDVGMEQLDGLTTLSDKAFQGFTVEPLCQPSIAVPRLIPGEVEGLTVPRCLSGRGAAGGAVVLPRQGQWWFALE
jgi:hypothetical protein